MFIEAYAPSIADLFKDVMEEADEYDVDKNSGMSDEEMDSEDEEEDEMQEGTEHDMGKEPDAGRDDTDAATAGEEDNVVKEDVEIDLVIEADEEESEEDSEEDEEPESSKEEKPSEDKKELEIPDELFDDDEDESEEDKEEEDNPDLKLKSDMDEELEDDESEEELDLDIEDDDESETSSDEAGNKEVSEEGLYMKKGDSFVQVSPEEYMEGRISSIMSEKEKLESALSALKGQLEEANMFNAKLAYVNKLYNSGLFNNVEKESIVERMDNCSTISEVKSLYATIVNEVKEKNPLDDFSNMIKEHKANANTKSENIYESKEMLKMKRLAGIL